MVNKIPSKTVECSTTVLLHFTAADVGRSVVPVGGAA
jgi:hypothetical protein